MAKMKTKIVEHEDFLEVMKQDQSQEVQITIEKYGNRFVDEYYNFVSNMTEILIKEKNEELNGAASVLTYQKQSHIEQ